MKAALLWLALALVSEASAKPNPPRKPDASEVRKREAKKRAERERAIQECMADRDGDPDADREICEDQVGEL